jgi:hypothetical protein
VAAGGKFKFQLITNVSEFGLFQSLAKTRLRLVIAATLATAAWYGATFWVAGFVNGRSTSVELNVVVIAASMLLLLTASYIGAMLFGDLFFPGRWRERVLLGKRIDADPNAADSLDVARHQNFNLQFLIAVVVLIAGNYFGANLVTGDYMDEYHDVGFLLTQLRSDVTTDKTAALAELSTPLYRGRWQDPRVKSAIVDELDSADPEIRGWAVYAVGAAQYEDHFDRLVAELDSDSDDTSAYAAEALGKLGDKRAVGALITFLERSKHPRRQLGALRGLAQLKDPSAGPAIQKLTTSQFGEVQAHAFWALGQVEYHAAHPDLLALYEKGSAAEKCGALEAMKYIPAKEDAERFKKEFVLVKDETQCPWVHWEDRDEIKTPVMYKGFFRTKFLKIIANSLVRHGKIYPERDWFVLAASDKDRPFETRKQADDIVSLIDAK